MSYMPHIPSIPLIRIHAILKKLNACGATSPETACTLREAGVINPDGFQRITGKLIERNIIRQTDDGKYYIG